MTSARADMAQIASDGMALVLTAALLSVWLAAKPDSWRDSARVPGDISQPGFEVSLQQSPADTPPAPRAPPQPVPRKVPVRRAMPRPTAPAVPVPADLAPMPAEPEPVPEGGAVVASPSALASGAPVADTRADLEAEYAAGLRADIDRRTHPPDSVQYRLHRPSGEVRVGFIVMRNGEPKAVRVLRSSGSSVLDEAAVAIVVFGHYAAMPAKVFAGEAEHVFAVTIEFLRRSDR